MLLLITNYYCCALYAATAISAPMPVAASITSTVEALDGAQKNLPLAYAMPDHFPRPSTPQSRSLVSTFGIPGTDCQAELASPFSIQRQSISRSTPDSTGLSGLNAFLRTETETTETDPKDRVAC